MYAFEPRIPVDHVLQLVGILRGAIERERGDVLQLCGATLGEVGALLKTGLVVAQGDVGDVDSEAAAMVAAAEVEPQFDIVPYIPLILKIIELIISRRG